MTIPVKTQLVTDSNSNPIQALIGSGARTNATAGVATSNAALPTAATGLVIVRCTDYIRLNFGTSGVTATTASTSILCPPGEGVYPIAAADTHFAVLRVGAADVPVQVETLIQS
jgi:hypothetical protein